MCIYIIIHTLAVQSVYGVVCNTITNNIVDLISYSWLIHISVDIVTSLAACH